MDVDVQTLRHNKYPNIFGLGDCNNLPTTKSYFGGFYQLHVVVNNVYRNLKGLPLNGKYDGYSKTPLYIDNNKLTYSTHTYKGPTENNLVDSSGGLISLMRYYWWGKFHKKRFMAMFMSKTEGPPYGKVGSWFGWNDKFKELSAEEMDKESMKGYQVIRK